MTQTASRRLLGLALAATVAATSACGSRPSPTAADAPMTAVAAPIQTYRISGAPSILAVGEHATLKAERIDGGLAVPVSGVTWSSSNSAVAEINSNGVLTAISHGTAEISFSVNGQRAAAESATIVTNISAAYRVVYEALSCSGEICRNLGNGDLNTTFSQTGPNVRSQTSSNLWGSRLRGTLGTDGSLDIASYVCNDPDYEPGVDSRLEDMRLSADGAGGFIGTGRFTHRVFSLGGTCAAPVVASENITTGTYSVRITRR